MAQLQDVYAYAVTINDLHNLYDRVVIDHAGSGNTATLGAKRERRRAVYSAALECRRLARELEAAHHELAGRMREQRDG